MNINNIGMNSPLKAQTPTGIERAASTKGRPNDDFRSAFKEASAKSGRVDKIQISHTVAQSGTSALSQLKNQITTDLQKETKVEKIDRISKQIENNEYIVDPLELAQIMFRV